ncbi:MAG: YraN family protein [Kineosporiaceae bacterium]|jgi:putative endonuclease
MGATSAVGAYGERVAESYLQGLGMTVLARGWRCQIGEIDIVAVDGPCLVVCEVKTRRSTQAGTPFEAVTPAKRARLRRLTAAWLAETGGGYSDVRIDVVAVTIPLRGRPLVEHLPGVV